MRLWEECVGGGSSVWHTVRWLRGEAYLDILGIKRHGRVTLYNVCWVFCSCHGAKRSFLSVRINDSSHIPSQWHTAQSHLVDGCWSRTSREQKYSVVSCFFLYWVDHMTTSIQEAFITMCRNLWYLDKNPQKLNIYIVYTQRRLFISRCLHVPVLWLFKGLGVFARSWLGTEFNRRFVQWNTRCSRLLGHLDLPKMAAWFSGSRLTANIH